MKYILLTLTLGVFVITTNGQRPQDRRPRPIDQTKQDGNRQVFERRPNRANIEIFKTKFITDQLALTPQEAEAFWPVYNEYKNSMRAFYKEKKDNEIVMQEGVLVIRKKLAAALKPILKSDARINEALKVDKTFLIKTRTEMMRRHGGHPPRKV